MSHSSGIGRLNFTPDEKSLEMRFTPTMILNGWTAKILVNRLVEQGQ